MQITITKSVWFKAAYQCQKAKYFTHAVVLPNRTHPVCRFVSVPALDWNYAVFFEKLHIMLFTLHPALSLNGAVIISYMQLVEVPDGS